MISEIQLVILATFAFGGAMLTAVTGWTESNEAFNIRKFFPSIVRALVACLIIVLGYQNVVALTVFDYVLAVLAGMGVDAGGKRVGDAVSSEIRQKLETQPPA